MGDRIMNFFTSVAYAADAVPAGPPGGISTGGAAIANIILFALIFLVFYFIIIRPESKKKKEMQEMLNNLKTGTKVVTRGGIIGTIEKIDGDILSLNVAGNMTIKVLRSYIVEPYVKPTKK